MFFASGVEGGWGTKGVKRVMISASLSCRSLLRVAEGHRTMVALVEVL